MTSTRRKKEPIKCSICLTKKLVRADKLRELNKKGRKYKCPGCAHRPLVDGKLGPASWDVEKTKCRICSGTSLVKVSTLRKLVTEGMTYRCKKCANRPIFQGKVVPLAHSKVSQTCNICSRISKVRYCKVKSNSLPYRCQPCSASHPPSNKIETTIGETYNSLTLLRELRYDEKGHSRVFRWGCKCGKEVTARFSDVRGGHTTSCGCYKESRPEKELYQFVVGLVRKGKIKRNDRKILGGKELDLYLPQYNLAIEFNGLLWHSEKYQKNKDYHLRKTQACANQGISLFHIWEDDWSYRKEQVKGRIKALLKLNKECIYARKTEIGLLSKLQRRDFYNSYHIQGSCSASINLGLFSNQKLVGAMSFVERKNKHYELVRFASSIRIIGGFSKLLKYFQRNNDWEKIISFADLSLSNGGLYEKTEWELDKILPPDYKYIIQGKRYHKFGFRHNQLSKKLKNYDPSKTEHQNMKDHNFYRIYDCGKLRFKLEN